MSAIAIKVENLSKRYRIGLKEEMHDTLGGAMASWVKSPMANFRRLRKLSQFAENGDAEDVIWALKDVSFDVKQGEVIGVIGRNGAGKSTLLKIISQITEPTSGRVVVRGRISSLLEVGTGFHPDLTGRENIYLNGAILGMKRAEIERKFDEIVSFSGVEKFLDTPVKRYSSGMRVRLAFSVAAHLEPEILLVDEVLAVGDAAFQQKCLGKMKDITYHGRTVLFVSHNMGAISALTNRCFCMEGGRVFQEGMTEDVVGSYLSRLSETKSNDGWADLTNAERTNVTGEGVQFKWVQSLDSAGQQKSIFIEREPITIRTGLIVKEPVSALQVGCKLNDVRYDRTLFTVPSPVLDTPLSPGEYVAQLSIDPNYLKQGSYALVFVAFAQGARRDHIDSALQITIVPNPKQEEETYIQKWVAGPFHFDYKWSSFQKTPISDLLQEQF